MGLPNPDAAPSKGEGAKLEVVKPTAEQEAAAKAAEQAAKAETDALRAEGAAAEGEAEARLAEVISDLEGEAADAEDSIETAPTADPEADIETLKDQDADIETVKDPVGAAQANLDGAVQDMVAAGLIQSADQVPDKPFLPFGQKAKSYKAFLDASKALDDVRSKAGGGLASSISGGARRQASRRAGGGKGASGGGGIIG